MNNSENFGSFMEGVLVALVFILIALITTKNTTNFQAFWYPNSGFIILEKNQGEKFGKYQYTIHDACKETRIKKIVRSNQDWQIGDTIYLQK